MKQLIQESSKDCPSVKSVLKDERGYMNTAHGAVVPLSSPTWQDLELPRKAFHMFGSIIAWIYLLSSLSYQAALLILGIYASVILLADVIRLLIPSFNKNYTDTFGALIRESERGTLNTSTYYVLSSLIVVAFFPKTIAVVSIFYLAFGDPLAAIVGMKFGRTMFFGKSLEGSLACFSVCLFIGLFFFSLPVAAAGAVIAALAEVIPMPLNDNFRIPIISAIGLMLVIHFFSVSI